MQVENTVDTTVQSPETQVDTPTQAESVEAAAQGTQETPEDVVADEKPKNDPEKLAKALDRAKSKIDRKTAAFHEERRLNDQLRREIEALKAASAPPKKDEDSVESYVDSRAEKKAREAIQETLNKIENQRSQEQRQKEFVSRVDKLAERMPDIHEVLRENATVELPQYLVDAIAEYDDGPLLAAYAFKEDLMDDIAAMSPAKALRELARLGDVVEALGKPKPVTKAPAPMSANKGTMGSGAKTIDNMSSKEVYAWFKSK